MTDEQKQTEAPKFDWVKPRDPIPQIYANYVHASWTLFDVRFLLGQLVPSGPGVTSDFRVEEQASVTVAWPEAKAIRDLLVALIDRYEKTNGEIQIPQLPPNT